MSIDEISVAKREDLIASLGNAMETAADEMAKGDYDVHQNV